MAHEEKEGEGGRRRKLINTQKNMNGLKMCKKEQGRESSVFFLKRAQERPQISSAA